MEEVFCFVIVYVLTANILFGDMESYSAAEARGLIFSGDYSSGYTSSECEEDADDFALDQQTECEVQELGGIGHIDVDTSEWKDVEEFDWGPHFHKFTPRMPSGPNNVEHLEGAKPCEFFKLFFSDELVEEITAETNIYAAQKRSSLDTSPNSRLNQWRETNSDEIYLLISLLLNMGIVRLPALHMYWTMNSSYNVPFFSRIMSRDRFQLLYHTMLHCCSTDDTNRIRGDKIDPIIQKLIKKFQRHYYPYKNVSSDETMIGYKGRVAFRRYMPRKPVKWGMLARTIADSKTGYIFNIKMDYGNGCETSAPPELSKLSANVFHLMQDHLDCGHHVFVDRLYSSVPLAEALDQRKTSITGTIMANRPGLPDEMKTTKLARGQKLCLRRGQLLALKWQDKKPISLLSTFCLGHMVVSKQIRGQQEPVDKPACIDLYNTYMGGVDLADQYNAYYDFARKSIKWWKKIFFWLVETSMTNSFIIYKMTRQEEKEVTLLEYRKMVIEGLVETITAKNRHILGTKSPRTSLSLSPEKRLDGKFHAQDKSGKQRACKACTIKGQNRRGTTYFCATCDDQPHLHPGDCFTRYHTLEDYKKSE